MELFQILFFFIVVLRPSLLWVSFYCEKRQLGDPVSFCLEKRKIVTRDRIYPLNGDAWRKLQFA